MLNLFVIFKLQKSILYTIIAFTVGLLGSTYLSAQINHSANGTVNVNSDTEECIVNDPTKVYQLQSFTEIAEEVNSEITFDDLKNYISTISFQAFKEHNLDLKTNQLYWGKFVIRNDLPASTDDVEWVLGFSGSWTQLDVFIEQQDGTFGQLKSGTFTSNQKKKFIPELEGNFIKLVLTGQQTKRVFFLGKGDRGNSPPSFKTKLKHNELYFLELKSRRSGQALYIGFIAMMLLYNLIFFFINRDRSYLYYSIYLSTLIIYTSFVTGDLADWIEPTLLPNHPQYLYFGKLAIYIGLIAYFSFLRQFLDLKKLLPKWDKLFIVFSLLGIPWVIIDIFLMFKTNFSYAVGDSFTIIYIGLFVLLNIAFAYRLYQIESKSGRFIVAGISALCLGFLLTAFEWMQSVNFSAFPSKVGSILEVILFSLGLAYRQWESQKAKQEAYFELEKSNLEKQQEQAESLRLKEVDELKGRLFTNLTHEFRTPLTVIMGMIENVKNHPKEKDLIRRNSKNLLRLVNQLLDLSKAEAKNLELNSIQSDIVSYLRYLTESFYSMATDKDIRLTFYSERTELIMDYDEIKIQHIIYNLLSNAIKFTDEDGKVIVHLSKVILNEIAHLKIKVQDTGIGIPSEVIPHLFDRFYQADNSSTRKGEGTGIGLTLTHELIQLMDGKIEVTSKVSNPENKSNRGRTEFSIWLPIHNKALPRSKALTQPQNSINNNNAIPNLEDRADLNDNALDPDAPVLLIIEDNPDIVIYIQSILENDYCIKTAKNGQLGIDKAIALIPDIIISDVMMPIKDGFEVCEILKNDERTSHIPIIILTAKAEEDDKLEGYKYGADAYLTKPFNKEELIIRLEKLISIRKQIQQYYSSHNNILSRIIDNTPLPIEDSFIVALKSVIEKHLGDSQFGVTELGIEVKMSQTQIYRKLKALTGQTPSTLIRNIRLVKGKDLLQNSDLSISEIAYKTGFSDPNYFSRTFQKEFGKSPRDFRK